MSAFLPTSAAFTCKGRIRLIAAFAFISILTGACGNNAANNTSSDESVITDDNAASAKYELKAIQINKVSGSSGIGDTLIFRAIGTLSSGNSADITVDVTSQTDWSVDNTADASLIAAGQVRTNVSATLTNQFSVRASYTNPSGTVIDALEETFTVEKAAILSLTVNYESGSSTKGDTVVFKANAALRSSSGTELDFTDLVAWKIDNSADAELVSNGTVKIRGSATASNKVTLTAIYTNPTNIGGTTEDSVVLNVLNAKISRLELRFTDNDQTPDDANIAIGRTSDFKVMGILPDNTELDVSDSSTLTSSAPSVIDVDPAKKRVTGASIGFATITASYLNTSNTQSGRTLSAFQVLTATAAEPTSLWIQRTPATSVLTDSDFTLTANYVLSDHSKQEATDLVWSVTSTNANAVLSRSSGNPTAFNSDTTGDYTISAVSGDLSADIVVTVVSTPDLTAPSLRMDVLPQRVVSSTGGYDISVDIDATDDIKVQDYFLSTVNSTPTNDDKWLPFDSSPVSVGFSVEERPTDDYSLVTVYAWARDTSGNISAVSSDSVLVIHYIDYGNSDAGNPLIQQQWYLENTGQRAFSNSNGAQDEDHNVRDVHNKLGYKGQGVRVVVVDDSLETTHQDLSPNVLADSNLNMNIEYFDSNNADYILDPSPALSGFAFYEGSHGSGVAGIIAMRDNNSVGGSGIAPKASLSGINWLSYQHGWASEAYALGMFNSNYFQTNANTVNCYLTMNSMPICLNLLQYYNNTILGNDVKPQNASIFNMSYGYTPIFPSSFDTSNNEIFLYGTSNLRNSLGAVYVSSAGNSFKYFNFTTDRYAVCSDSNDRIRNTTSVYEYSANDIIYKFNSISSAYKPCHNANTTPTNSSPFIMVAAAMNALGDNSSYSSSGSNIWITGSGGEFGFYAPAMVTADRSGCNIGYDVNFATDFDKNYGAYNGQNPNCNYISSFNGTSSASPSIAGIAALMLEANPNLTWLDVKHILAATARKPVLANTDRRDITMNVNGSLFTSYVSKSWEGNTAFNGGFSNNFGWGIADAKAALEMALDPNYESLGSALTLVETAYQTVNGTIPNMDINGVSSQLTAPSGGAAKVRFVAVDVDFRHELLSEVTIRLENTTKGISSTLFWAGSGHVISNYGGNKIRLISNAFYDMDYSNLDEWRLTIYDTEEMQRGTGEGSNFTPNKTYNSDGAFNEWKLTLYTSP